MKVLAAGGILWRKDEGELKVLLIHRIRYDDWSWPKGKLDKGEHIVECAVREIQEETGLKVHLGPKLYEIEYELEQGKTKLVHYWSAQVTEKALKRQNFRPDDEVSALQWMTIREAKRKLTYKHDIAPLNVLVALDKSGALETKPLVILRHAKATPRTEWSKGEATRPLLPAGKEQAQSLQDILASYDVKRVVSSKWRRCMDTVKPFVLKHKVKLIERSQLSELGAKNGPQRTHKLVHTLVESQTGTVLCSHRPALPIIVQALEHYSAKTDRKHLAEISSLKPGSFYLVYLAKNNKGNFKIAALEQVEV
ncbi:MAG: NUDIX hydrolase [Micrococcales bacterium]|nr:NUDIX hydrolase [Micrococcales bacterium]NBT46432.1 NUDIX hydrolase [Actinomycetota bacterium]NBY43410.1 NUDIX hydrolase [Micrococcales bacterium]